MILATYGQVVAVWLKREMRATGWTNKLALARESGVGRSRLYEILSGNANPGPDTVAALAAKMGVDGPDFALGAMQEPSDVSGWIGQAQDALNKAAGLLRARPTERPEADSAGKLTRSAKRVGRVEDQRPDGARKGKGAA